MSRGTCPDCRRSLALKKLTVAQCIGCSVRLHSECVIKHLAANPKCRLPVNEPSGDVTLAVSPSDLSASTLLETDIAAHTSASVARDHSPPPPSSKRPAESPPSPSTSQTHKQQRSHLEGISSSCSISNRAISSVGANIAMSNENESIPSYFQAYLREFRERSDRQDARLGEISLSLQTLTNRVDILESRGAETQTQANVNSNDIARVKEDIQALKELATETDSCELLISGITPNVSHSDEDIVKKISQAIDLPNYGYHIVRIRPWIPARRNAEVAAAPSVPSPMRAIVFKLPSPSMRDDFAAAASKLANLTSQQVLGSGGNGHLSIRPLWPKRVYDIWRKSLLRYRDLNYMRPFIRNGQVYMRATRESDPIHITSPETLAVLPPRTLPPTLPSPPISS